MLMQTKINIFVYLFVGLAASINLNKILLSDVYKEAKNLNNQIEVIPVVVVHGLSETCEWRQHLADYISSKINQPAFCIETGGGNEDYFTSIKVQAEKGCKLLQENEVIKSSKYFDIVGLSQGGLIARYIVEECSLKAVPRRFFSIGGPQMGVAKIPSCPDSAKCDLANYLVKTVIYNSVVQNWIGPAGYFKAISKLDQYKKNCIFLPLLNNERLSEKSSIYKTKFSSLDLLVLIKFDKDTTIIPRESEWFEFYDKDGKLIEMEKTELYTKDLIGLKILNENGKVLKFSINDEHLHYSDDDINNYIIKYLK